MGDGGMGDGEGLVEAGTHQSSLMPIGRQSREVSSL